MLSSITVTGSQRAARMSDETGTFRSFWSKMPTEENDVVLYYSQLLTASVQLVHERK